MSVPPVLLPAEPDGLSLAETAYRRIRDQLIMVEIAPGEPINESHLTAELGLGRTPVREALKRLEIDHLVMSYPRRGTFATMVDISQLADISEIRELLEPLAARRAAAFAGVSARAELRSTARELALLSMGTDQRELLRYDLAVHRLIYRASANPHLEETLIRYGNLATRIWCLTLEKMPPVTGHITEHGELLAAIAQGQEDTAAQLALDHVRHFQQAIRKVL